MIRLLRKKNHWKDEMHLDNMTPMIDIAFILLIFFILTSNAMQQVYQVKVPTADSSFKNMSQSKDPIKVTIFANHTFAVGTKQYKSLSAVKSAIKKLAANNKKVIIIPDAKSDSGLLISLLTFLDGNGITNVEILVENNKA